MSTSCEGRDVSRCLELSWRSHHVLIGGFRSVLAHGRMTLIKRPIVRVQDRKISGRFGVFVQQMHIQMRCQHLVLSRTALLRLKGCPRFVIGV